MASVCYYWLEWNLLLRTFLCNFKLPSFDKAQTVFEFVTAFLLGNVFSSVSHKSAQYPNGIHTLAAVYA